MRTIKFINIILLFSMKKSIKYKLPVNKSVKTKVIITK